jgi:AcrR family transcriptional regulator
MTITQIRKVALTQFIEKGYEGASLSDIANEVGIKKQSIYTHYKSKDELFLSVMSQVIDEETEFLHDFFSRSYTSLRDYLERFVLELQNRYLKSDESNIKFVLRMAYMPPTHLKDKAVESFNLYFLELEALVHNKFAQDNELSKKADDATLAFMTMLDGLLISLIYGGADRFTQKFKASWGIYWAGLFRS